ncbi:hypothetical protein BJ170DRAFT_446288 [Xylariales sp. AK1849]|nr:hypothetical protein BJ170DRAFT_446288 [Xylariales sp. AK1849]
MATTQQPTVVPRVFDFQDFDDEGVFNETRREAAAEGCENFVVDFGPKGARIARNLKADNFAYLLQQDQRGGDYPIRWINIWDTSAQKEAVGIIGERYAFSQRLLSLMIFATTMKRQAAQLKEKRTAATNTGPKSISTSQLDVEKGLNDETEPRPADKDALPRLEGEEIELYLLLKDTVQYTSIDQTEKALCIGAHWLHKRPLIPGQHGETDRKLMPPKHWLWLTLCDDNTIVTFNESPTFEPTPKGVAEDKWRQDQIQSMRANSLNVLLQQSCHGFKLFEQRPLSQSLIRTALKQAVDRSEKPDLPRTHSDLPLLSDGRGTSIGDDGTSLLFYYLFEDYAAAGPLKAAGRILEEMTPKVLTSSHRKSKTKSSQIIPRLHNLSKDLRTLKHLFENYKILITKIMSATTLPDSPAQNTRLSTLSRSNTNVTEPYGNLGADHKVYLTQPALQRFDRLRDRLQGLMLSTIDGQFEEITALSDTYFNLTQQKDSAATAKLTRSATLLAKLSVFFLPISFMTSYFSIQIEDLYQWWTASTYWYAFAVIAGVSFVSLFFFARVLMFFSDVLDEWAVVISHWCRRLVRPLGVKFESEEDED